MILAKNAHIYGPVALEKVSADIVETIKQHAGKSNDYACDILTSQQLVRRVTCVSDKSGNLRWRMGFHPENNPAMAWKWTTPTREIQSVFDAEAAVQHRSDITKERAHRIAEARKRKSSYVGRLCYKEVSENGSRGYENYRDAIFGEVQDYDSESNLGHFRILMNGYIGGRSDEDMPFSWQIRPRRGVADPIAEIAGDAIQHFHMEGDDILVTDSGDEFKLVSKAEMPYFSVSGFCDPDSSHYQEFDNWYRANRR